MKKIMFNDRYGLTQAVIDGRKTMTRRIVPQSLIDKYEEWYDDVCCIAMPPGSTIETLRDWLLRKHTRYYVGEIVAVAQSYNDIHCCGYPVDSRFDPFRTEDWDGDKGENGKLKAHKGWNNKMYVKAGLMPYHIKITGIRIERLQNISDEDCLREGVRYLPEIDRYYFDRADKDQGFYFNSPREAFAALIDKVSGAGTWDSNPFVVVYGIELIK